MVFLAVIAAIVALIVAIKFPIFTLAAFMFASLFKGYLTGRFDIFLRFDLTVLATLYVLLGMFFSVLKRPDDVRKLLNGPFVMMLLLASLLFLGLTYTSAPNYGWAKTSRYAVFGSVMFLAPLLFLRKESDVKLLLWIFIVAGLLVSFATIFNIEEDRATFMEATVIGTAERIGLGILISFCFIVSRHSNWFNKAANAGIVFVSLFGLILTGSRGALYGLVLCSLLVPFVFWRKISLYWILPGIVMMILGLGYSMAKAEQIAGAAARRIAVLWQYESGTEAAFATRMPFYSYAMSNFSRAPVLGHGTGAFAVDFGGEDVRRYPHNIFLELAYENGLIGVALFTVLLVMVFKRWRQSRIVAEQFLCDENLYMLCSIAGIIFVYLFLQMMKSNDIDGNRLVFFSLGLITALYYIAVRRVQAAVEQSYYSQDILES